MVGEQKLINKILQDGKHKANVILKKAEEESVELLKTEKQNEASFLKEQIALEKQKLEKELAFNKALSNLEKNKIVLKAKNEIIIDIFNTVLQKLQALKPSQYSKFLEFVLSNAKTGDTLIISSKKGEKEKFSKLETFKKKKLSISMVKDEISGGAIIVGKTYDLDFTFESLVKEKFEKSISNIAKNLF